MDDDFKKDGDMAKTEGPAIELFKSSRPTLADMAGDTEGAKGRNGDNYGGGKRSGHLHQKGETDREKFGKSETTINPNFFENFQKEE